MKKFKKLIPALCMLLVSAVMLGSTTFAWFSMNNTVTATGMEVAAKSDELFLTIKYGSTYDETHSKTTATSGTTTKTELLPVDHGTVTGEGTGTHTDITSAADMTDNTKWYYAYSDKNTVSSAKANTATQVSDGNLGKYIASETFTVGVYKNSGASKFANLNVTSVNIPADKGLVLVLVCGDNVITFTASGNSLTGKTLTGATGMESAIVTAYYYIDGTSEHVYSDNAVNITGKIEFTLSATAAN